MAALSNLKTLDFSTLLPGHIGEYNELLKTEFSYSDEQFYQLKTSGALAQKTNNLFSTKRGNN